MDLPQFFEENDTFHSWLDSKAYAYRMDSDGYSYINMEKIRDKYYITQSPFILSKCFTWVLDTAHSRANYHLSFDSAWEAYNHYYKFIQYDKFITAHTPTKPKNITKNIVQYIIDQSNRKAPHESRSNSSYYTSQQTSQCR